MAAEARSPRLAVLIDADNASPRITDGLFEEVAKIGEASVRRIYGDFSGPRLKAWADILSKHAIIPHQQFAYITGKNASDIALVIDAVVVVAHRPSAITGLDLILVMNKGRMHHFGPKDEDAGQSAAASRRGTAAASGCS